MRNRKAAGLDIITLEVGKTRKFDDLQLRFCNTVYNQNPIDRWTKGCILPFPKKGDLGITKNYRGITPIFIAANVYNTLLLNRIEPEILRKNQNNFRRNWSTSQILVIRRIIERVYEKKPRGGTLVRRFLQSFWFHTHREDGANTSSLCSPERNCHSDNDAL